jgi:hypothetical protein
MHQLLVNSLPTSCIGQYQLHVLANSNVINWFLAVVIVGDIFGMLALVEIPSPFPIDTKGHLGTTSNESNELILWNELVIDRQLAWPDSYHLQRMLAIEILQAIVIESHAMPLPFASFTTILSTCVKMISHYSFHHHFGHYTLHSI